MKKNKKIILYIILVLVIGFASYSISFYIKNTSIKIKTINCDNDNPESKDTTTLKMITCSDYNNIINGKKANLVLFARPTCEYCNKFIPIIEEIVDKYNIEVNYLDIDTLSNKEAFEFYKSSDLLNINKFGTPMLAVIKNGKIKYHSTGYISKKEVINWLKVTNII